MNNVVGTIQCPMMFRPASLVPRHAAAQTTGTSSTAAAPREREVWEMFEEKEIPATDEERRTIHNAVAFARRLGLACDRPIKWSMTRFEEHQRFGGVTVRTTDPVRIFLAAGLPVHELRIVTWHEYRHACDDPDLDPRTSEAHAQDFAARALSEWIITRAWDPAEYGSAH